MVNHFFPGSPQDEQCTKCGKTVVIMPLPGQPGLQSACKDQHCPINSRPDIQITGEDGVEIIFADEEDT